MSQPYEQHEVWIELYDYDWNLIGPIDQFKGFQLDRWDLGDEGIGNCKFSVPFELGVMQTNVTKSAVTKTVYQWGPAGELHLMVWCRGRLEHSGVVVVMEDDETEQGNSDPSDTIIDVKVESWGDIQAYLARRFIMGIGADRYAQTSTRADVAIENLINANCKAGDVIEPAAYALLGTGVVRQNFGSVEVQATSANTGTMVDRMRWDHGEPLWDQVSEKCLQYGCRLTSSWDKAASPPILTIHVQDADDLRVDRTSSILFSRENGGLLSCPRTVDLMRESNVAQVSGRGTRVNRIMGYAINQTSYDAVGLMETGDVWASADDGDAEDEAEFIIAQVGGSSTTYKPHIIEHDGAEWGVDFEFDAVKVDDSLRGITIEDWIVAAKFTLDAPQNLRIELTFGRDERNENQKSQRAGGGGSGGSRGGGKPKRKDGEASGPKTVTTNNGQAVFDEAEEDWELKGEVGDRVRPGVMASDPGTAEGGQEQTMLWVEGTYFPTAPSPTGYVLMWDPALGRNVKLLTADDAHGGGDPPTIPPSGT